MSCTAGPQSGHDAARKPQMRPSDIRRTHCPRSPRTSSTRARNSAGSPVCASSPSHASSTAHPTTPAAVRSQRITRTPRANRRPGTVRFLASGAGRAIGKSRSARALARAILHASGAAAQPRAQAERCRHQSLRSSQSSLGSDRLAWPLGVTPAASAQGHQRRRQRRSAVRARRPLVPSP